MQTEILFSHGQAKLLTAVYLKPGATSKVVINIKDEDIEPNRDWYTPFQTTAAEQVVITPDASHSPLQARFNEILGPLAKQRSAASIGDDYQTLMDAFEERLDGR